MQIPSTPPPSNSSADNDEVTKALLVKRAVRANENEQLALIESARITDPSQPLDGRLIGRILNEKV